MLNHLFCLCFICIREVSYNPESLILRCSAAEELELDIIYMFSSKKMLVACGWSKISDL
jgi:hypothetical protein